MSFWNTVMDAPGDAPHGKRLIPVTVDNIAKTNPDRVCFSFPRTTDLEDGFQDMNFRTFANAINKTAHFIQREIGRSSMFETVLYLGYPDVRYFIALVALMKTGHKVLFSSHRNSVSAHADLIKRTDCTILLHTTGFPVGSILEKCRMETLCMPELAYLLDDNTPGDHYPYNRAFEDAKNHPCLVVHTRGSTGHPKAAIWTHDALTTSDNYHHIPPLDGRPNLWGAHVEEAGRSYCALPLFVGIGIAAGINKAVFNDVTVVIGPPGLETAEVLDQVLTYGNVDVVGCTPQTLEEVADRHDILQKLGRLKRITYVGGQLNKEVGDLVSKMVPLYCIMTSSEASSLVQHATDREDWEYICLHPTYNGIEMRPVATLHELIFVKQPELESFQVVFKVFPTTTEYSTSDLYSKHPTKAHHWKFEGRRDDMIKFKDGWIFNPTIHERAMNLHPIVQNSMIVGTGRDKPAAIIELCSVYYTEDKERKEELRKRIWKNIEDANSLVETRERLEPQSVIFSKKEKPFKIANKGTIQRKATVRMYEQEIQELYNGLG